MVRKSEAQDCGTDTNDVRNDALMMCTNDALPFVPRDFRKGSQGLSIYACASLFRGLNVPVNLCRRPSPRFLVFSACS